MAKKKDKLLEPGEVVVLAYANNSCYVNLLTLEEALKKFKDYGFTVDTEKQTWTWTSGDSYFGTKFKFGDSRYMRHYQRFGVIACYVSNNFDHLCCLASAGSEATDDPGSPFDD
jgi:hypothetical protein